MIIIQCFKKNVPKRHILSLIENCLTINYLYILLSEGWVKIEVAGVITKWIENDELSHLIQITCHECERHESLQLLSLDDDFRPFIVVNTFPNRKIKRQRRNINCHAGSTECCREQFYVNFTEMNWNDWIVHPPGYHAYFCRGSCSSAATIPLSGTYHNSVIRVRKKKFFK